jgi:hypothetical protein
LRAPDRVGPVRPFLHLLHCAYTCAPEAARVLTYFISCSDNVGHVGHRFSCRCVGLGLPLVSCTAAKTGQRLGWQMTSVPCAGTDCRSFRPLRVRAPKLITPNSSSSRAAPGLSQPQPTGARRTHVSVLRARDCRRDPARPRQTQTVACPSDCRLIEIRCRAWTMK